MAVRYTALSGFTDAESAIKIEGGQRHKLETRQRD